MSDDFQLVRNFVEDGADDAFRTLVERHARMVYGSALRVTGDNSAAEEVTQAVFILLARKAAQLRASTVIAGWLYRTARFVALQSRRAEQRRRQHQDALSQMNTTPDSDWEKIAPVLEEAVHRLASTDRDAVVLRFFEEKTFAEVAAALGTSEAAAKMRVSRAIEKLRSIFATRGVNLSIAALMAALAAHAAPVVPEGFAGSISSAALASQAAANASLTTLVTGALKIMAWNKVRNTAVAALIVLLLGGGAAIVALKHHRASRPITVRTFAPMAGEWEGTFVMSGDGLAQSVTHNAALSINAVQGGRACQIEMRVLAPDGGAANIFRFTHSLNERGDRIITLDDPNIARPLGEGHVTVSSHDTKTGEWRAGFHASIPNNGGATDCEWSRTADQLSIVRRDHTVTSQGSGEIVSELRLQRVGAAKL